MMRFPLSRDARQKDIAMIHRLPEVTGRVVYLQSARPE
jgi:hypothetical protein